MLDLELGNFHRYANGCLIGCFLSFSFENFKKLELDRVCRASNLGRAGSFNNSLSSTALTGSHIHLEL